MKCIVGIALGVTLGATGTNAGSIGGYTGGNSMYYDAPSHTLYIPGKLAERFAITRSGGYLDSDLIIYSIAPEDFNRLRNVADTLLTISARGESDGTRSYRVYSGDENSELELIDRRAAIRSGTNR